MYWTDDTTYFAKGVSCVRKMFIKSTTGVNVIKFSCFLAIFGAK